MPGLYDDILPSIFPSVNPEGSGSSIDPTGLAATLGYGAPPAATPPASSTSPTPTTGPVVSPEQVPDAGAANAPSLITNVSLPKSQSVGMGAKVGVQGYSPSANAAIRTGPGARLEKQMGEERAAAQAEYDPLLQQEQEATQAGIDAALKESHAESGKAVALSEGKQKVAAANKDFLAKEQAAVDNSRAEADAIQNQYRTALADYQAAKINPAQLWDYGGVGGQVAMIATAFGHDFLAAKGIQTSGLESINKAIQNNINAQLENMNKKLNVAQGFKELWNMQRAQSNSDAEARQRMSGFYLASLSNEIEAQLGGYDSELALAKGAAAVAKLKQEQVKNDLLVRQHIDTAANQRLETRVKVYAADLAASTARYTADAHVKAAQIAADAKEKKVSPLDGVIFDTSKTGQNVATRRFLPDVPNEERAKLRQQTSKVSDTAANVERLIDLQAEAGKVPPTDLKLVNKLQGEIARTAEALRTTVKMGIIYDNSGKQINEQEVKLYDQLVAKNDWFTNGDNVRQLGQIVKTTLDKNNAIMRGVSTQILPGDPAYGVSSGDKAFDEGNSTLGDIQSGPGAGRPQETPTDKYKEWAYSPNAGQAFNTKDLPETGPGNRFAVEKDWAQFRKDLPDLAPDLKVGGAEKTRIGPDGDMFDVAKARNIENPDRLFIQLERLADLALQGDQQAKGLIDEMAKGKAYGTDPEGLRAAYAQWEKTAKGI